MNSMRSRLGKKAKVLNFAEQHKLHTNHITSLGEENKNSIILSKEEFMDNQLKHLGVVKSDLAFDRELSLPGGTTITHYSQRVKDIKVFGSRVSVTTGRHGGVIKAAG